jgi:hypothetical protein
LQVSVDTLTNDPGRGASPAEAAAPHVSGDAPGLDHAVPRTTSLLRPHGRKRLRFSQLYAWHLKPFVWRLFHPGGTPEEYYARSIAGRVSRGDHPAIGAQARSVRAATELLDILLTHGLQPGHVVVDYGCGSFRLGKALIEHLEPGRYWGLDVIDEFLESGMALLEPELKAAKLPNARVISPESLAETAAARPDFIISWHVCSKVPPSRLADYFGKIVALMGPVSLALVHFPESERRLRQSRFSWSENRAAIAGALRQVDPGLDVRFVPITEQVVRGVRQTMVEIRRKG